MRQLGSDLVTCFQLSGARCDVYVASLSKGRRLQVTICWLIDFAELHLDRNNKQNRWDL